MTTPHTNADVVASFYAALRSNDVEAWLANFAADAIAHDPVGAPPHHGHTGLRAFLSGILGQFERFGLTEDAVFHAPQGAAVKWTGSGRGRNGRQVEFHGIDVFEFDHEGKIVSLKAYWDAAPVMATLAAAPLDQE
jgi:steroid delta-isomerase